MAAGAEAAAEGVAEEEAVVVGEVESVNKHISQLIGMPRARGREGVELTMQGIENPS